MCSDQFLKSIANHLEANGYKRAVAGEVDFTAAVKALAKMDKTGLDGGGKSRGRVGRVGLVGQVGQVGLVGLVGRGGPARGDDALAVATWPA